MVITRTPTRLSLFGGGTDFPDFYRQHGGIVIGGAINKYIYITCKSVPPLYEFKTRLSYSKIEEVLDNNEIQHNGVRGVLSYLDYTVGVDIHYIGDLPSSGGVGSSSSFVVGLIKALHAMYGVNVSNDTLATEAIRVERELLQEPGGHQDEYWAAFGGFNKISFLKSGDVVVEPLPISTDFLEHLEQSIILYHTNIDRKAGEITSSYKEDRESILLDTKAIAEAGLAYINEQNLKKIGELLSLSWEVKKSVSPNVTNSTIDEIYKEGLLAGAYGGKIMGAGGGGMIMFLCEPEKQEFLIKALAGLRPINIQFDFSGSRILFLDSENLK